MGCKSILPTFILLVLFCFEIKAEQEKNLNIKVIEILDTILNSSVYDPRVRPFENNDIVSPTEVKVNMFIRMMGKVDDIKMQYNLQVTLRQKWFDQRLKYNNMDGKLKYLNLFEQKLWSPDLFVSNEKSGFVHGLMKPNQFYRIFPDGGVLFSSRVSLVLSCPMNYKFFPFDSQVCVMRMASYGFTTNEVIFAWDEDSPVQMVRNMVLYHYTLEKYTTDYCHSRTGTGSYSCLSISFYLKRNLNHYLIHLFMPTTMLVIISWISFWLDHQFVMTRLFPVLATLLVLQYWVHGFNELLPAVNYTKSVDIWTGTCLTFIFAALIEVVVVDYRWRKQQKKQRRATGILETTEEENAVAIDMKPLVSNHSGNSSEGRQHANQVGRLRSFFYRLESNLPAGPKRLDVISRYLFPAAFTIFNVFYWLVNLVFYAL